MKPLDELKKAREYREIQNRIMMRRKFYDKEIRVLDKFIRNDTGWFKESNTIAHKKTRHLYKKKLQKLLDDFPEHFL